MCIYNCTQESHWNVWDAFFGFWKQKSITKNNKKAYEHCILHSIGYNKTLHNSIRKEKHGNEDGTFKCNRISSESVRAVQIFELSWAELSSSVGITYHESECDWMWPSVMCVAHMNLSVCIRWHLNKFIHIFSICLRVYSIERFVINESLYLPDALKSHRLFTCRLYTRAV